jgi:purine-binding chemotaxis protein CheW
MMKVHSAKHRLRILHFQSGEVTLCADLGFIKKVLPLAQYENVPNSPYYLVGLINLAGTSIPVIDLSMRLGLTRVNNYSLQTPVILCSDGKSEAALIVDAIHGIENIDSKDLQMETEFTNSISYVVGTATINGKIALLLDIPKVMAISLGESQLS